MQELREIFRTSIENKLVPFLKKYGFDCSVHKHEFSNIHDVFQFTKKSSYINIAHMGFNPHDVPWSFALLLGKQGFKKTSNEFDSVPLWYIKQKIAPPYDYQREAIKMNFDEYLINTPVEIKASIRKVIFDLDTFCKDFLTEDFVRFNRIREIKYLEYLVQTQVITEANWLGVKKSVMRPNKEID
jgi:hypothetical protein